MDTEEFNALCRLLRDAIRIAKCAKYELEKRNFGNTEIEIQNLQNALYWADKIIDREISNRESSID